MKYIKLIIVYTTLILLSSCTNPALIESEYDPIIVPNQVIAPEARQAEPAVMPEYIYTIIGTWQRDFDGHYELYVFTQGELVTYCDGIENGRYNVEHLEDWTFELCGYVYDYELLHSEEDDYLILNNYQYKKQ